MKAEDAKILVQRYLAGQATREEAKWVEMFMDSQLGEINEEQRDGNTSEPSVEEEDTQYENFISRIKEFKDQEDNEDKIYFLELKQRRIRRKIGYAVAASITLLIIFGMFRFYFLKTPIKAEIVYQLYEAPLGGPTYIRLSDSSEVWLSEGTKFRYPKQFDVQRRTVEIIDGLAYFKIHHEANRPFLVKSGSIITKDIGTSFTIKAYEKSRFTQVSLLSGKVSIDLPIGKTHYLNPSEQIIYDKVRQKSSTEKFMADNILSWKDGAFCFQDEPFGDVIEELSHRFHIRIKLKYAGLARYPYTAKFPKGTSAYSILKLFCDLNLNKLKQINSQEFLIQ